MTGQGRLAEQFEQNRPHLRAVAYGMLGSVSEAEDAVQEAWLRLGSSDTGGIDDLRAWLTTVVGRISLDMLRSRKARREYAAGSWLPEPLVGEPDDDGPEHQAVLADSIGLALLVVLESLTPAERLAFVLHDVFAMPFDEVARIMERSPDSARQLASRAAGGSRPPRSRTGTSRCSAGSSTPSWPPPARATSRRWSRSSIPEWCSAWISARTPRRRARRWPGPARWPGTFSPPPRGS
jgi:RNA polymerase sigma factor (sigma-70 family)